MSWLWVGVAFAATGQLRVDAHELAVGQSGHLALVIADGQAPAPPQFAVPEGLEVRFARSERRFVGDAVPRTLAMTYTYTVTALRPGTWTVGPLTVELRDTDPVTTNPVQISVRPRSETAGRERLSARAGFVVPEAFEGQVVVYRYEVRSLLEIMGSDWRLPRFEGLRRTQHGDPYEKTWYIDDPDGRITVLEGAIALVATGTGDRTQGAALAQLRVPAGRPDLLGFRQYRSEIAPTEEATLFVHPLPTPPADFSGLVGQFVIRSTIGVTAARVGESVPWQIEVRGDGTLEGFAPPTWTDPAGMSLYDSGTEVTASLQDGGWRTVAVYKRVIVPSAPGRLEVEPLGVVTFDPVQQRYVSHAIHVPPIQVVAGGEDAVAIESFDGISRPLPAAPAAEGLGFRAIYRRGADGSRFLGFVLPAMSALASLPVGAVLLQIGGGWVGRRLRRRRRPDDTPRTPDDLLRDLDGSPAEQLLAVDAALRLALSGRVEGFPGPIDRRGAVQTLPEGLREELEALFDDLDRARYADGTGADLVQRARDLVGRL